MHLLASFIKHGTNYSYLVAKMYQTSIQCASNKLVCYKSLFNATILSLVHNSRIANLYFTLTITNNLKTNL